MPDYIPENWETGDTFEAADATAMSQELEEGEQKDAAQDAQIAALQAETPISVTVAESTPGNPISLLNQDFPTGAVGFRLSVIMPGQSGASGRRGAAGSVRNGGGAGPGGGMVGGLFVPKPAGAAKWHLSIPSAGNPGAAVTTDNTNGNAAQAPQGGQNGGAYGRCWITDGSGNILWSLWLYPGSVPAGGTNAAGAANGGGFGLGLHGTSSQAPGNGVAGPTTGSNGSTPCAGGPGGSMSTGDAGFNGTPGGWCTASGTSIPTAGIVNGALPNAGTGVPKIPGIPGNGGSGGAASNGTSDAQAGADAIGYGGGGGGGGASPNGKPSGAGGRGGPGWACVEMVYA